MYQSVYNQKLLKKVLIWSSVEGILFQAILIIHNLFLFKVVALSEYGKTGFIFSIAYGLAYCMTTGFDIFYGEGKSDTGIRIIIQLMWIGVFFGAFSIIGHVFMPIPWLALTLSIAEALKRSLKIITLAHHRFVHVTSSELLHLALYCSAVWSFYFLGYPLSMPLLIVPLIISTLGCALSYTYFLTISWQGSYNFCTLLQHRALLCAGTFYHILFSGNVMTPLAYVTLGPVYAGGIKLASTCTHGIISIIERVLTTSATLLCNQKDKAFLYKSLGNYVWLASAFGAIMAGGLVSYTFWKQSCFFLLPYALLYIILHIAGIAAVLCERVFLAESPTFAPLLTMISIVSISISLFLGLHTTQPMCGIILFVLTRILLSIGLGILASRGIDQRYFAIMSHNLLFLFCALFLCVFFMRQ